MIELKARVTSKYGGAKIRAAREGLRSSMADGLKSGGDKMAKVAVAYVAPHSNTGELEGSIRFEITSESGSKVIGAVMTDALIQALTLEFGTGLFSTQPSKAKSIPWYVHESMADLDKYGFDTVTNRRGDRFYVLYGAHPHPYMRPAYESTKDYVVQEIANSIKEMLGRL